MTTLTVLAKHRTSVELGWTLVPGVGKYKVERAEPGVAWQELGVVRGPLFTDPTCKPKTIYGYRVTTIGLSPEQYDVEQATTLPNTEFSSVDEFFTKLLREVFARDPDRQEQFAWCAQWREHREAAFVVESLWRSYEAHRPPDDPLEPSSQHAYWLVQIAYPLMQQLWMLEQTFRGCIGEGHDPQVRPLPG